MNFEDEDFIIIEDNLKQAKFAIEDIIDTDPPQKLIRELRKVVNILEIQIEKDQNGEFD